MSEECTHNCETCSANCSSKNGEVQSLIEKPNEMSKIGKVIGVVSGKGGVGSAGGSPTSSGHVREHWLRPHQGTDRGPFDPPHLGAGTDHRLRRQRGTICKAGKAFWS